MRDSSEPHGPGRAAVKTHSRLKRSGLKRGASRLKRSPINHRSPRRQALQDDRRAFVAELLGRYPNCQVCPYLRARPRPAVDVHETLRRSAGGAIVPGQQATAQGQTFLALCRNCHNQLTNPVGRFREYALRMGWIQSRFRQA